MAATRTRAGDSSTPTVPPLRLVVAAVVICALVVAAAVVVFIGASPADRHAIVVAALPAMGAGMVAGLPALFAYLRGEQTRQVVHRIDRQTNGVLDRRIRDGVLAALDSHTSTLIPQQPYPAQERPAHHASTAHAHR